MRSLLSPPDPMTRSKASLDQIFQTHIHTLALALRYDSVVHYRCVAPRLLCYLHDAFPQLYRLSQLRRDAPSARLVPLPA